MGALFLFARALEGGERTGTGVAVLAQGAGDGELAALAAMFLAPAARTGRLGALGGSVAVAGGRPPRPLRGQGGGRGARGGGRAAPRLFPPRPGGPRAPPPP